MTPKRLKAEERCAAIRQAMREVFAEKGFAGTTTRELAKAAGVSEALLYRHFPSKEAMYAGMIEGCLSERVMGEYNRILALEPSTSTLVLLTHFIVSKMFSEVSKEKKAVDTLAVRSMFEDGEFMRVLQQKRAAPWHKKFRQSLEAARKGGEVQGDAPGGDVTSWFVLALCFGMMMFLSPSKPVLDVQGSRSELIERGVWFVLLGIGLKPETVRKHYNPKALSLLEAAAV